MTKKTFETLVNIEPQEIEWLWRPYIPYNMTTIMDGDPNVGKSFFVTHVAAAVSSGGKDPEYESGFAEGNVLYFSAEDEPSTTIRPRLEAMGGKRPPSTSSDRLYAPRRRWVERGATRSSVVAARSHRSGPPYAYVGPGTDIFRPNEIRTVLAKLSEVAKSSDAALLLVRHLTKGKHDKAI